MKKIEQPVVSVTSRGTLVETHPAYAQIMASRISGQSALYGSDFLHQNFIRIRVSPSELHRDLSHDNMYNSVQTYIEVDLSEAQWATFVSAMSVNGGTGCTLNSRDMQDVPALPRPADKKPQFTKEARQACQDAMDSVEQLRQAIEELSISQKQKNILLSRASSVTARLNSTIPFIMEQFGEYMESTVEKAKIEVNAYTVNAVQRAGLQALKAGSSLLTHTTEGEK